jgi:vacuolar protein sorting-associated protein 13A/C
MKPIEGAESDGALGFFKGVGRGLVGLEESIPYTYIPLTHACSAVTKPVVGVFDLASNVAEGYSIALLAGLLILMSFSGIRNTTTVFDDPARDRVRLVS